MIVICNCGDPNDERQQRSIKLQEQQVGRGRRWATYGKKKEVYRCTVCAKDHKIAYSH